MKCKSCNKNIKSSFLYCPYCGGKVITKRLGMKGTGRDFLAPLLSWDNHFKKTFKDLLLKPHVVVEAYLNGATKRYFHPFSLLVIYATLALLLSKVIPTVIDSQVTLMDVNKDAVDTTDKLIGEAYQQMVFFFKDYYNLILIFSIPLSALISRLTFRKQRHNYAEHLVIRSYFNSFTGLIGLFLQTFAYLIFEEKFTFEPFLIFIYFNYSFSRLYALPKRKLFGVNIRYGFYSLLSYGLLGVLLVTFFLVYIAIRTS